MLSGLIKYGAYRKIVENMKHEFSLISDSSEKKLFYVKKRLILFFVFLIILSGMLVTAFNLGRYSNNDNVIHNEEGEYTFLKSNPTGYDACFLISEEKDEEELTIQEIYKRVNPAVVTVIVEQKNNTSIGSGIIFAEDGYILTNAHVIKSGFSCRVCLSNGNYYDALLVGYNQTQDLAVLKVEAEDLPVVKFGNSNKMTVGDSVYAIGTPLGVEFRGTLTDGIVSAINRDVEIGNKIMTLIQTNVALNEGNSGGPLINVYGQVIGINTIKMNSDYSNATEGLGFAIPITDVAGIVNELIEYGEVKEDQHTRWSPWSLFNEVKD
jgi:S1-C subfamily serine protease